MLEVSFPVTVPEPGHHMFLFFQNPLPENFAATHCSTCRGVPWHQLGTVVVDAQSRCGAACTSERAAVTRVVTVQTDGHDKQEQQQDNVS